MASTSPRCPTRLPTSVPSRLRPTRRWSASPPPSRGAWGSSWCREASSAKTARPIRIPREAEEPLLSQLYAASVRGQIAAGPRAGQRLVRLGDRIDGDDPEEITGPRCASVRGFSLHADVCVPARDRNRLERLCRYVGRPPVTTERLSELPDGRILYRLRHRWRDGTTHVVFEPLDLVGRLAVLVPPPRVNTVRYHGILAPCAGWRDVILRDRSQVSSAPALRPSR